MYKKYFKRLFDIVFSLSVLIILSPLLLLLSILVRIKHGSPIVFKQLRPGKDEKIFSIFKFRTMTNEKDVNGNLLHDDMRLTKFGKFLRKTSCDELLEFYNILKGDMSVVGPRPLLVKYLPYYTETERLRHTVRPGLTGLAAIKGRNTLSWEDRFKYDIEYVEKINFKLDLKIIFLTIGKIFSNDDILIGSEEVFLNLDAERKENEFEKL